MSIADQSCAQAVQKSKEAHKSKRNNKAVSENKLTRPLSSRQRKKQKYSML